MPVRNILSTLLVSACLIFASCSPTTDQALSPDAARPTVQEASSKAAVAMPDRYAAQVSKDILRAGGNAVDAAIAAGFALAITYPEAGNIGGGGFMLIHIDGEAAFLDYRETAPLAAHRNMYLDEQGDVIEKISLIGIKAAGVPGTVAGLWAAHQHYGTLVWKDLLMPAVDLAANGFLVTKDLADRQLEYRARFAVTTNFDQHFGNLTDGAVFKQPELARTLLRIAASGAEDFYA